MDSLIFVCLEMLLVVSASYSVSRGVSYQPVEHHALRGQSFMNISGISAIRCSARCLSHHGCFSFNYDHINRVCQMNNATREQVGGTLGPSTHLSHYSTLQSFSSKTTASEASVNSENKFFLKAHMLNVKDQASRLVFPKHEHKITCL